MRLLAKNRQRVGRAPGGDSATIAPPRVTRRLNSAIGRLQFALDGTEPWLIDRPGVGHKALEMIQAAAKMRKKHPDAATDAANPTGLLNLSLALEWEAEAEAYVADPLGGGQANNPRPTVTDLQAPWTPLHTPPRLSVRASGPRSRG
jgi:hypothetical protein